MNIREILTKEEISELTTKTNYHGLIMLGFDWLVITSVFVLAAVFPNPVTIFLGIIVLGGRQLAFGVLVHECGHKILFKSPWLNQFCGTWLCGYAIFSDMRSYSKGHLKHHQFAGTRDDPDLPNYQDYPIPLSRMRRKITRDLTGQVGYRRIKSIWHATINLARLDKQMRIHVIRSLGINLAMLAVMTLTGHPWLYLMWLVAFMTSHMLVSRIRQIGEHGAVPNLFSQDPRDNTRTVYANPLEKLLVAPHGVNYHLEHHIIASVPIYRLKQLHETLLGKGIYENTHFPRGYVSLIREVTYAGVS